MYEKFNRVPAESIEAGDICVVCGIDDIQIRETIADRNFGKPLPSINIEEATAKMAFSINMSPFVGREFALYCRRRERYEFMVGTPKVIYVKVNDKLLEPFEIATVEEWKEYMGVVELLGKRRGQMIDTQGIGHCCCWSLRLRKSVFHSRSSLYSSGA